MNSPEKAADHVLGTSTKVVKDFLMECVNLPDYMHGAPYAHLDEVPHFDRWLRKWHRLFTFQTEGEDRKWHPMEIPREQLEAFVPKVRIALCRVWIERDARQRIGIFTA